jgi:flagellar motility protein MotE (MotC chaperone)
MSESEKRHPRMLGFRCKMAEVGLPAIIKRMGTVFFCTAIILFSLISTAVAQDDMVKLVEAKRVELKEKEESLRLEEARLNALRKDVDEKIATYTKLLAQIESVLKKAELAQGEKIQNVVKAYEVMSAEDAAARLSALDDATVLQIMTGMKSKKAGAIIAAMAPKKAASLTRSMTALTTKQLP